MKPLERAFELIEKLESRIEKLEKGDKKVPCVSDLVEGKFYKSKTHGTVVYEGVDCYMGETTFKFKSHEYNQLCYWKESSFEFHLEEV